MMVSVDKSSQRGSALVYILIAIALLAALTVSFMEPSGQQTQSQNTFKLTSELESQIEFIRTNVQECVVLHSGGDSGIDHTLAGTDPGANRAFPIDPRSARLTTPSTATSALVRELGCPGNPGDDPVPCVADPTVSPCPQDPTAVHEPIFSGSSGKFMPPPPALFGEWQWYNGVDGVFFWIASNKTDAYITTALDKLNEQFGACEADVVTAGGTAVALDNAGDVLCPANSTCFRLWMITHTTTSPDPNPADISKFSAAETATCP
jgi:hypothetical protein